MTRKISINLYVGEHHFPLTVTNEEEELLREATKLLNDKLSTWQKETKYQAFSKEKITAGAALTVIAELLEKLKVTGKDSIEEDLEEIRIILEDNMMDI